MRRLGVHGGDHEVGETPVLAVTVRHFHLGRYCLKIDRGVFEDEFRFLELVDATRDTQPIRISHRD